MEDLICCTRWNECPDFHQTPIIHKALLIKQSKGLCNINLVHKTKYFHVLRLTGKRTLSHKLLIVVMMMMMMMMMMMVMMMMVTTTMIEDKETTFLGSILYCAN